VTITAWVANALESRRDEASSSSTSWKQGRAVGGLNFSALLKALKVEWFYIHTHMVQPASLSPCCAMYNRDSVIDGVGHHIFSWSSCCYTGKGGG
jgi:hypothetical protein